MLAACLVTLAFSVFAEQTKSHPQIDSLYRQGLAAVKRGDLVRARAAFEQLVHMAPANGEARNSLGWVLFAQGKTTEAISQLRTAILLKPGFPQAHINL